MEERWLDEVVAATTLRDNEERLRLDAFLEEPRTLESLLVWLVPDAPPSSELALSRLLADVAALDELIQRQLDAVLHSPELQRLEASWRGLAWLVESVPDDAPVKVRLLPVSWKELARDADRAIEFDQSQLFKKVYSAEFGSPGGEPYGILIGDYYVSHRPRPDQPVDDVRALRSIAQVAAAAFVPFVASAHSALLGLDSLLELERPSDLMRTLRGVEYTAWRSLRDAEDSRFLALTMPRILMRGPYVHDPDRRDGFPYTEATREHEDYLWGNAAFALGRVAVRAFARWGWLADIRGTRRGDDGGGLVTGLPAPDHGTDSPGVAVRFAAEVVVTERQERVLADLGLVPLCAVPGEDWGAFHATPSLHAPPRYATSEATINARLGTFLQYVLCVSRIAHYIKVISRDLTGSLRGVTLIERRLSDWLHSITTASDNASEEIQARCPLRESAVSVREIPGKPGCYTSVFHLRPHFQLDQMTSTMRLVTEIVTDQR
jgi:type VI secretion system ImpC/EvpB family protein